jgi:hypothetical protein
MGRELPREVGGDDESSVDCGGDRYGGPRRVRVLEQQWQQRDDELSGEREQCKLAVRVLRREQVRLAAEQPGQRVQ